MSDNQTASATPVKKITALQTAINILTSPREAIAAIDDRPTKLFPLAVILLGTMLATTWYYINVDYSWYVDDTLSMVAADLTDEQLEAARDAMMNLSQSTMMYLGVLGSGFGLLAVYVLQAGYLSLASALNGDKYRFGHWFSLICWTSFPTLLGVITMVVTIVLNPGGQLSITNLNALSLASLGMQSGNTSLDPVFSALNLTMFWSLTLVVMAYRQWLDSSLVKAMTVVLAPYLLIFGIWAYFALS